MPADSQYITLSAPGVGTVRALMQETPPKLVGGNPRWDVVERPRRPSLTLWRGRDPLQLEIPLLFDGIGDNEPVEDDLNTLDRMRRSPSVGEQPPAVKVAGAVPRRDIPHWVITDITYGDNVVQRMSRGVAIRMRQDVVVTLQERIDETRVSSAVIKPRHPFHTVKSGETLADISRIEYGDVSHVAAIRKANGLSDSRNVKVNTRLRMP